MECPDCGHDRTSVIDTRSGADGTTVRRRRECSRCSFRFTTYERPEWETLQVKKRDGSIEPFDAEKIRGGVERAVEKRPVSDDDVDRLIEDIQRELRERGTRIVSSKLVGELVSENLRAIDSVAYIRFVSVYKAFSDPEEFVRELDQILDEELDGDKDSGARSGADAGRNADENRRTDHSRSRDESEASNETDAYPGSRADRDSGADHDLSTNG